MDRIRGISFFYLFYFFFASFLLVFSLFFLRGNGKEEKAGKEGNILYDSRLVEFTIHKRHPSAVIVPLLSDALFTLFRTITIV